MKKSKFGEMAVTIAIVVAVLLFISNVEAATYFSVKPGKEVCTSIAFGQHGRGEYTLTASEPAGGGWIDNHFTSFTAGSENIIVVPVCFSARDRRLSESAIIRVTVSTPSYGNVTYDYGVCVANYEDVDVVEGAAGGNACDAAGGHTDIFSASFTQPEMYASPGETVTFTLLLDSSMPLTLGISKGTEQMRITASRTTVEAGNGQQSVLVQLTAPSSAGDYDFSVIVSAEGCSIADCRREVNGVVHVRAPQQRPQVGYVAWVTPATSSIIGQVSKEYNVEVQNYGDSQEFTVSVALDEGLESNFAPYSTFIAKGGRKSIPFTVRPSSDTSKMYRLTATVVGADGTSVSSDTAWLTVDEMVADAALYGRDASDITTVEGWQELKSSVTGAAIGGNGGTPDGGTQPEAPAGPNLLLIVIGGIAAAVILILVFIIYKRTVTGEPLSWESLGVR